MKVKASSFQSFRQLAQSPLIIEDSVLCWILQYIETWRPICHGINWKQGFTYFVLLCIFKLDVTHSAMKLASFVSLIENAFSYDKTPESAPFFKKKVLTYVDF